MEEPGVSRLLTSSRKSKVTNSAKSIENETEKGQLMVGSRNEKWVPESVSRSYQQNFSYREHCREYQVKWVGKAALVQRRTNELAKRKVALVRNRLKKGKLGVHSASQNHGAEKVSKMNVRNRKLQSSRKKASASRSLQECQPKRKKLHLLKFNRLPTKLKIKDGESLNKTKKCPVMAKVRRRSSKPKPPSRLFEFPVRSRLSDLEDHQPETGYQNSKTRSPAEDDKTKKFFSPSAAQPTKTKKSKSGRGRGKHSNKSDSCVCEECGKVFSRNSLLLGHRNKFHVSSDEFKCPSCPKTFAREANLWGHYQYSHMGAGASSSDTPTKIPKTWRRDRPTPLGGMPSAVCHTCGKEFHDISSLCRHVYKIHGEGANAQNFFICPSCGRSYKSKDTLNAHIRQIHEGEDYRCDVCRKKCQSAGKLWRHKIEVHKMTDLAPPPNVVVYNCEFCDEQVLRGLEAHVKTRHPEHVEEFLRNPSKRIVAQKGHRIMDSRGKWKAVKTEPDEHPCSNSTQKKREYRKLLLERGLEAAKDLIPQWMHPKKCPVCGDMIDGAGFRVHVRKHETGIWVRGRRTNQGLTQSGTFVDKLKVFLYSKKLVKADDECGSGNGISCTLCSFKVKRFPEMKVHFISCHPQSCSEILKPSAVGVAVAHNISENCVKCEYCSRTFVTETELRSHLEFVHPDDCWKCPDCSKIFLTPEKMWNHFESGCSNDEEVSKPESLMTQQEFPDVPKVISNVLETGCKRCPTISASLGEFRNHVKETHPHEYQPCQFCLKVYHTGRALLHHLCISHDTSPDISAARQEIRQSFPPHQTLRISCQLCNKMVALSQYSRTHLKVHHGIEEICALHCKFCPNVYKDRPKFLNHVEEYHGDRADMKEFYESMRTIHADFSSIEIKNLPEQDPAKPPARVLKPEKTKKKVGGQKPAALQDSRRAKRSSRKSQCVSKVSESNFKFAKVSQSARSKVGTGGRRYGNQNSNSRRICDFTEQELNYMTKCFVKVDKLDLDLIEIKPKCIRFLWQAA